jgi:uroporphyrinogen decarboxylase
MTPRENLLSLFRRQGYDHVPVEFMLCPALHEQFAARTGGSQAIEAYYHFPYRQLPWPTLPAREPVDWSRFFPEGLKAGTGFWQEFGIAYEPGDDPKSHFAHIRHPMAGFDSVEQIQSYPFADFAAGDAAPIAKRVATYHAEGLLALGKMEATIWEIAWYLRGMETLMMDMAAESDMAVCLLDTVTEFACLRATALAASGADILFLGDDLGMQSNLLMSPSLYRAWIKPRLAQVTAAARAAKPDVLIAYHTCGYVTPLIQDLIEAGVDILNPVQPECMDFAEIHKQFGDRLSFWGTIGTQTTMPFGTPEDVRQAVWRNLDIAGARGGLFCTPTHVLEPEVPWANIEAYVEACRAYRGQSTLA